MFNRGFVEEWMEKKNVYVHNRIFGHKKNVVLSFEVKRTELQNTLLDQMNQAHKEFCPKYSLVCGSLEITLGTKSQILVVKLTWWGRYQHVCVMGALGRFRSSWSYSYRCLRGTQHTCQESVLILYKSITCSQLLSHLYKPQEILMENSVHWRLESILGKQQMAIG